jgi:hypothetical protein
MSCSTSSPSTTRPRGAFSHVVLRPPTLVRIFWALSNILFALSTAGPASGSPPCPPRCAGRRPGHIRGQRKSLPPRAPRLRSVHHRRRRPEPAHAMPRPRTAAHQPLDRRRGVLGPQRHLLGQKVTRATSPAISQRIVSRSTGIGRPGGRLAGRGRATTACRNRRRPARAWRPRFRPGPATTGRGEGRARPARVALPRLRAGGRHDRKPRMKLCASTISVR